MARRKDHQQSCCALFLNTLAHIGIQFTLLALSAVFIWHSVLPQHLDSSQTVTASPTSIYSEIDRPFYNPSDGVPPVNNNGAKPTAPNYAIFINLGMVLLQFVLVVSSTVSFCMKLKSPTKRRGKFEPYWLPLQWTVFSLDIIISYLISHFTGLIDLEPESTRYAIFYGCISCILPVFVLECLDVLIYQQDFSTLKNAGLWALYGVVDLLSVPLQLNVAFGESSGPVKCPYFDGLQISTLVTASLSLIIPALLLLALSYSAREESQKASSWYPAYLCCSFGLNAASLIIQAIWMGSCGAGMTGVIELVKNIIFTVGLVVYGVHKMRRLSQALSL